MDALLGDEFRWIAPSRFGYLRSSLPEGATWDDQAAAYVRLIDRLGIERVAVVALSQGGASGLLLAASHPERVASLTCLSCGVVASGSADQASANANGDMLRKVFAHDYTYWPIAKFFKRQLMGVLGASDAVVSTLTPEARAGRAIDPGNEPLGAASRRGGVRQHGGIARAADRGHHGTDVDRAREGRGVPPTGCWNGSVAEGEANRPARHAAAIHIGRHAPCHPSTPPRAGHPALGTHRARTLAFNSRRLDPALGVDEVEALATYW